VQLVGELNPRLDAGPADIAFSNSDAIWSASTSGSLIMRVICSNSATPTA
jgi:hypothetical protein